MHSPLSNTVASHCFSVRAIAIVRSAISVFLVRLLSFVSHDRANDPGVPAHCHFRAYLTDISRELIPRRCTLHFPLLSIAQITFARQLDQLQSCLVYMPAKHECTSRLLIMALCLVPPEVEASFVTIIDSILAASDLDTITEKTIRKGLQQQVEYDITPQKVRAKTVLVFLS